MINDANGQEVDIVAFEFLADNEIKATIAAGLSDQEFYDAYCVAHAAKFGTEFVVR